ncbi:MAG: right-handed parallel beta-helix repeat-containing protein [Phycisphaerae bacterium]|nr:right-handed parallel beta-helix repeat-containing protein [Phycisphaerae bacterium]
MYMQRAAFAVVVTMLAGSVAGAAVIYLDGRATGAYEFGAGERCPVMWYVQADANSPDSDGKSWETALPFLQDALMLAGVGDEVRVAQGVYRPGDFALSDRPGLGRAETFALATGVTIKGGYAGLGAPDPDARDVRRYETILSGDLAGTLPVLTRDNCEAVLTVRGREEYANCYHVVSAVGVDGSAVLEGVTITGGTANGPAYGEPAEAKFFHGGGVYVEDAAPVFVDCTITGNIAFVYGGPAAKGGGMYCTGSQPTLVRCRFVFNWVDDYDSDAYGAGMANDDSSPILTDCTFESNGTWNWGGAMANMGASSVKLAGCAFLNNRAQYGGGAIYHAPNNEQVLTATNCLLAGNRSGWEGGAVKIPNGRGVLTNCTFTENRVRDSEYGRAVACDNWDEAIVRAVNCIFRDGGGEFVSADPSWGAITFSNVEGGWEGQGNIDVDPLFVNPGVWYSTGTPSPLHDTWTAGDYHLKSQAGRWDAARQEWVRDSVTSPCIDAGDPRVSVMYEPFPNGGVINMGAHGGTAEASKTYFGEFICEVVTMGDLNGDCVVNLTDLALLAGHWMEDNRIGMSSQGLEGPRP